ncbi:MAG: cupin domain-containing protein [Actinomycetota bacterium]
MTDTRPEVVVDEAELARRVIEPDQFVADTAAFIDVRIARSKGKASYSFVGPGVSQNKGQTVNLTEPHGFNVGAASMPHGVVNNPHLHYTAEVFLCTSGSWRFAIGESGQQTLDVGAGTVFSAPTWVFRGFENTGPDDGWLFVVLGGDDTGGIIWAPTILDEAAETGLYLGADGALIESLDGAPEAPVISALSPESLASTDRYTDEELAAMAVTEDSLAWSDRALLSAVLDGHASSMAPVIGYGLSQDRGSRSPLTHPHGFSVEWLRLEPGTSTGLHRHGASQVVFTCQGTVEVTVNDADQVSTRPAEGSVVSTPPWAWRSIANVGTTTAMVAVVCGGDGPNRPEWAPDVVTAAAEAGWMLDAAGCVAPRDLVKQQPREK